MAKLDKKQTGLILGIFLALVHLIWAILVWIIPGLLQSFLDWMFVLHGLVPVWKITTLPVFNALLLVIMTFITGYITGWVFAWVWNMRAKK